MMTINTDWITYINIGVIIIYVIFMIMGARKGIIVQILSSLGTVISFIAAWRYCGFASGYYNLWPKDLTPMSEVPGFAQAVYSHLNELIWFILLFVIFRLLFLILEKLCSGLAGLPVIKEVSGLFGGVLGAVSATVWIMIICVVLNMPFFKNGREITGGSLIGKISDAVSGTVTEFAGPISASETIGNLYQGISEFGDQDMEAIGGWLSEHGINPNNPEDPEAVPDGNAEDAGQQEEPDAEPQAEQEPAEEVTDNTDTGSNEENGAAE